MTINSTEQIDTFLCIKADKVTQLLDLVGELGLATITVTHHPALAGLDGLANASHRLELITRQVQELTSSLRLVPASQLFQRMRRLARDLAQQTGKSFDITINGEEIEIDKTVVDQLADPLIHLVRNAADHGIESAAERQAAGKPAQGRIILSAAQQGQEIHITVSDDGKGLDRQAILNRARAAVIVGANEEPVDATVWNLIFESGFSTAAQVSNLSGRGVGMDVVQSVIRNLRGRIEVNTTPGQGTHIKLIIPVSLAFLSSMIVRSINRLYAIPINSVSQVFKPGADQVVRVSASGDVMVRRQDALVPVHWIHNVAERALNDQVIVVLQTARGALGLPVDEIIGEEQVMMKPLPEHLQDIRGGAGCAILGSGAIAIALDAERVSHDLSGAAGALR